MDAVRHAGLDVGHLGLAVTEVRGGCRRPEVIRVRFHQSVLYQLCNINEEEESSTEWYYTSWYYTNPDHRTVRG